MAKETQTQIKQFDNGLVLLGQEMPWSESVSYSLRLPCGTVDDPDGKEGLSGLVTELVARGAGDYDNRGLLSAFENLGAETSESVAAACSIYHASLLPDKLNEVLPLTADMVLRPRFPEEEFDPARSVLLQEIASLEDEPSRKMSIELGRIFFPKPWGHPSFGTAEGLEACTLADAAAYHARYFSPKKALLGIAGRFDWNQVCDMVERLFGEWTGEERTIAAGEKSDQYQVFLPFDSAQTHIGFAAPALPVQHPDSAALRCGINALSGGMSSRLFTEVREKRGLCYSVFASYVHNRSHAALFGYCGSSSETAQEALDVILAELDKIGSGGITAEELERTRTRSKCALVIGMESTGSRADAMIIDWAHFGRCRSIAERTAEIDALTLDRVNGALEKYRFAPLRLAVLGPEPLTIDEAKLG